MSKAWLVFKKDWTEIKRNWQVLLPIIIVPIIFAVVLPAIVLGISGTPIEDSQSGDFETLIGILPLDVQAQLANFNSNQIMVYIMVLYFFAPFS
jgi:ABC-type Na+ efflux pump permease subunit